MLFKSLDKLKRDTIMSAIVLMFIGNILMFVPATYFGFLNNALGFLLLVIAVSGVFRFISNAGALIDYIRLTLSLFAGLMGIVFFAIDDMLMQMLTWLVGVIPIIFGGYGIWHALAFARRSGRKGWWILILLSAALMVFGGVIFWNPWMDSSQATIQVIGGTLMFSSIISALRLIWLWPIHKD